MKNHRAVIMDRDGTILEESHYLDDPEGIEIYAGVIPALRKLKIRGWKLIVGTNQSGIGRGYFSKDTLHKIHDRFLSICRKRGLEIDEIYYCPHHPKERCACRKPKIGMLRKAERDFDLNLKDCVVVGDKRCDIDWGRRAGARTILVLTGYGKSASRSTRARAHYIAKTLTHAVQWILKNDPTT